MAGRNCGPFGAIAGDHNVPPAKNGNKTMTITSPTTKNRINLPELHCGGQTPNAEPRTPNTEN
jgi:hypothetical protein